MAKSKNTDKVLRIKTDADLPDYKTPFPLDEMDRALLEMHQEDVFFSYNEFAEKWGVTVATVRNRIKRLREAGVMDVILVLNPYKIGYTTSALIGINLNWEDAGPADVIAELECIPGITTVMLVTGRYDVFVRYVCQNLEAFRQFLAEDLRKIRGIAQFESFVELDLHEQKFVISRIT